MNKMRNMKLQFIGQGLCAGLLMFVAHSPLTAQESAAESSQPKPPVTLPDAPRVVGVPQLRQIESLKDQLRQLRMEEETNGQRYSDEHPTMMNLKNQIHATEEMIAQHELMLEQQQDMINQQAQMALESQRGLARVQEDAALQFGGFGEFPSGVTIYPGGFTSDAAFGAAGFDGNFGGPFDGFGGFDNLQIAEPFGGPYRNNFRISSEAWDQPEHLRGAFEQQLDALDTDMPEFRKQLDLSLRPGQDPEEREHSAMQLNDMLNQMRELQQTKRMDPDRFKRTARELDTQQAIKMLAQQYSKAKSSEEKTKVRTQLNASIAKLFDLKLETTRIEAQKLESELKEIQRLLAKRQEMRDQLIERRVNEMLGEDDVFDW